MVAIFRRKQLQVASIKVDAVEMPVIRIAAGFPSVGHEIEHPILLVDLQQLGNDKITLGHLVFEFTGIGVV